MAKVLVLYYSAHGHIGRMAEAVAEGVRQAGAEVVIKRVPELVPEQVARKSGYKLDQKAPIATVNELAEPFPISLPAISRHLKVLEQAGLISRGRDGQRRPCQLRPEPLVEIAAWAEHTRAAWEQRLDRLDAHLRRTSDRTASPPTLEKS